MWINIGDNIYNRNISISRANRKQSNLFNNTLEHNKVRTRSKADKEQKK